MKLFHISFKSDNIEHIGGKLRIPFYTHHGEVYGMPPRSLGPICVHSMSAPSAWKLLLMDQLD